MTPVDPGGICEAVLDAVGGHAEAEVTAVVGGRALTRFANSHIHQNVAEELVTTSVKVCVEGRQASASSTMAATNPRALADKALSAARLRPVDEGWPGLAEGPASNSIDHFNLDTAQAGPELRAGVVSDFVNAGTDSLSAGFFSTSSASVAFANSAGHRSSGRTADAMVEGIHRRGLAAGRGWQRAVAVNEIDGSLSGRTAFEKATAGMEASELPPGHYEVILEPGCVADILDFLSWYGFNAKAHAEGQSFAELGQATFAPSISIYDDATDIASTGLGFDAEGTAKARLDLVSQGVVAALPHDRRTARAAGTQSTGHAVAGGESFGPLCTNLFLAPGVTTPSAMVASVKRGLLVTELWYTRILDPKTQVVTGLTRNGLFLIENGAVVGAVRNLRFTQSYVDALGPDNVVAVGNDARLAISGSVVPSLHLASWNFTGGAQG